MRKYIPLLMICFCTVGAQEQSVMVLPGETEDERCLRLANEIGRQFRRCSFYNNGAIASVSGNNLGTIDFLSAIQSSEEEDDGFTVDRDLLAREVESFLDTVRPLTLLRETPTIVIEDVDLNGSIEFCQLIHGIRLRSSSRILVNPLSGRVRRISPIYYFSSDAALPPSETWLQQEDAMDLAVETVAAEIGAVGEVELQEHSLYWEPTGSELRPQWRLIFRVAGDLYAAFVDALSGDIVAGEY